MGSQQFQVPKTLVQNKEENGLILTLVAEAALKAGQEVRVSGDNTVNTRTGAQYPIGICVNAGSAGGNVEVRANISQDLLAIATGGTLAAGAFVKPNGTFVNGVPQYVAVASGDYAVAIVLKGGAANSEIRLGILKAPVVIA